LSEVDETRSTSNVDDTWREEVECSLRRNENVSADNKTRGTQADLAASNQQILQGVIIDREDHYEVDKKSIQGAWMHEQHKKGTAFTLSHHRVLRSDPSSVDTHIGCAWG